MFRAVDYPDENLMALYIGGTVTKADYEAIVPNLNQKVAKYDKLNVYLEYQGIEDITLKALWEELKQDVQHFTDFNRAAVVSADNALIKAGAAIGSAVTPATIKHFTPDQKQQAMQWVRGDQAVPNPRTTEVYSA